MQLAVLSTSNSAKKVTVSAQVFGAEVNPVLIAQAVRVYQARLRQGTSKTKTRSEIARTKKKWFKQKGTGNARHGARTPNIFVGGGVSHGPNGMQNWDLELSQAMKHQALISALSLQAKNAVILDAATAKSDAKALRKLITKHSEDKKTLVILPETQVEILRKIQNMGTVLVTTADQVTVWQVAMADVIVLLEETVTRLETRLVTGSEKKVVKTAPKAEKSETTPAAKVAKPTKAAAKPTAKKAIKPKKTTK